MTKRRRDAVLGAAVAMAVAGLLGLGVRRLGGKPGPALPAASVTEPPSPGGPAPDPVLAVGTPPALAAATSARRRARPRAVPTSLAGKAASDYRERARLPRWTQPLRADEADPIAREREVTPISAAGPQGAEPLLTVFPASVSFEVPDPVIVYAYLSIAGTPAPAQEIRGTVLTETLAPLGEFAYLDDGMPPDLQAGDGIGSAEIVLPSEALPDLSASYLVKVRALTMDGEERLAAMSFQYASPHARPTGNYRDRVVDGSLLVGVEVEVARAGRFHLEGTLYTDDGQQKIAWAQAAAELPPGRHWIDLPYYGLVLREGGMDGPYLLRYLALSTTSDMPNAKNRLVENAHVTAAYRASTFTDVAYDDPDLLDAADRLEATGDVNPLEAGG